MDVAVPIAFPDYLISVNTPQAVIEVPDLLPFVDLLPGRIVIKEEKAKLPYLGHAGVLFFDGATGLSKYYEYGRYDRAAKGLVRRVRIPDVKPGDNASIAKTLNAISHKSGQGGAIKGAYIEVASGGFKKMLTYAAKRERENRNRKRKTYDITSYSCLHFAMAVCEAGGASLPPVVDPRPTGHLSLVRMLHRDLDFKPPRSLTIDAT